MLYTILEFIFIFTLVLNFNKCLTVAKLIEIFHFNKKI